MTHVIAGGGIAGLAAGLALARAGREVRLYEQEAEFSEFGAGLQLGPNGVKALQALGAWEAVRPGCYAPEAIHIRDGLSGKSLKKLSLARFPQLFGAPYRVIHRADLLAGLLEMARREPHIHLETGRRITGFSSQAVHFAKGPDEPYRLLIGADGIGSIIRRKLLADGPAPYAGQMIARALIPAKRLQQVAADVHLWLYPGGHMVAYPVSSGRNINLVAAFDSPQTAEGWQSELPRQTLLNLFAHACSELLSWLQAPESWRQWPGAERPAAQIWGRGPVSLIGDAAHPTLPYLAQGAVMALEDAVSLGRLLPQAHDLAEGLRKYEANRQPRTAAIVKASSKLARIYHARGPIRLARNSVIKAMPTSVALSRMGFLYDWTPP